MTQVNAMLSEAADDPLLRLRHRGPNGLAEQHLARRKKVIDRLLPSGAGKWLWRGQSKKARGQRYPQIPVPVGNGVKILLNVRHVVFYLSTG